MKLLVIGHGRHGKDEVAETFQRLYGLTFKSSSQAAADIFLYDKLKKEFGYSSPEECYTDRHNKRARWHQEISQYNTPDKSRLAKDIMKNNDIYVGMRCYRELQACNENNLFDFIIWVDAGGRVKYREGSDSFSISSEYADHILDNSGTLEDLENEVISLYNMLEEDGIV